MKGLKYVLIFAAGVGAGVGGSAIFFKRKCDKIKAQYEKDLDEMDAYYKDTCANCGVKADDKDDFFEVPEFDPDPAQQPPQKRQGSFATDYGSFYEATTDPAESEHPTEEEEPIHVKQTPKIIRAQHFGMQGYSTKVLYYYVFDDALIPEEGTYEDIIDTDEVKDTIGNALVKYGFSNRDNEETDIYVRNFDRKCDYHIIKVVGSLSEDYGG